VIVLFQTYVGGDAAGTQLILRNKNVELIIKIKTRYM